MIKAGSVEVRGLKLTKVAIRNKGQKDPNLEFYTFQPYVSDKVHNTKIMLYYMYFIMCIVLFTANNICFGHVCSIGF